MTPFSPVRRAWSSLGVLSLVAFITSMDLTLTTLLIEPMKRDMRLSDVQIALVQGTFFGLAYGLCALPMGWLIDRANRQRLVVGGIIIWAGAMVGSGLAGNFIHLAIWRVGLGIVTALLVPAALSMISDLFFEDQRAIATSIFTAGQACGQAFGILAGGVIFDWLRRPLPSALNLATWRILYIAAGIFCLGLMVLLLTVPEPARQRTTEAAERSGWIELWAHRGFLAPLLAGLLFTVILVQGANVWAAALLIRKFGLTPGEFAGWLSLVTLAGLILGTLGGGQLAQIGQRRGGHVGALMPAVWGSALAAPFALFGLAPTVPIFAVLLGCVLLFAGLIPTVAVISISLNLPSNVRGRAIGAYLLVSALLGTATAPAAIALVSHVLGGEGLLGWAIALVCAPAGLAASTCYFMAAKHQGRAQAMAL